MKKVITILITIIIISAFYACSGASSVSPLDIKEHPALFGSVAEAEEAWKNADKKAVIFPSSYEKYNDNTLLIVESNEMSFNEADKDIINSFEIYFKDRDINIDSAIEYAKEYFPYDIVENNYKYSESEIYNCVDGEKYYVAHYTLKDGCQGDSNIYVIFEEEAGTVNYLTLGTVCPNWMNRSTSDYTEETWNFKF